MVGKPLDNVEDIYYRNTKDPDRQPPVQFINDDVKKLNKELTEGRYFYTQIKQEGVILFDSGNHKLPRRRKLNFAEIKEAAENYYHAIHLVFTLKDTKQHNLFKLSSSIKHYSTDLSKVFPRHTAEEKRLFNLLNDVYVEARYNADFELKKEDINALIPKIEFGGYSKTICEKKIAESGTMEY